MSSPKMSILESCGYSGPLESQPVNDIIEDTGRNICAKLLENMTEEDLAEYRTSVDYRNAFVARFLEICQAYICPRILIHAIEYVKKKADVEEAVESQTANDKIEDVTRKIRARLVELVKKMTEEAKTVAANYLNIRRLLDPKPVYDDYNDDEGDKIIWNDHGEVTVIARSLNTTKIKENAERLGARGLIAAGPEQTKTSLPLPPSHCMDSCYLPDMEAKDGLIAAGPEQTKTSLPLPPSHCMESCYLPDMEAKDESKKG